MKPLEEYMLFTKQGSETVRATMPAGVRSAQCAVFHVQPHGLDPPKNDSNVVSNPFEFFDRLTFSCYLDFCEQMTLDNPPARLQFLNPLNKNSDRT